MKWTSRFSFFLLLSMAACGGSTVDDPPITVPPAPAVLPELPDVREIDGDRNRVDDRIDDEVRRLRGSSSSPDPLERARAQAELSQPIRVECIFSTPVTADQIARFEAAGGSIRHVFQAISYGWVGTLPRERCDTVARDLGAELLVVKGDRELVQFMDEATRVGRVRPVWASDFAGSGFSGSTNVTIAILDSGLDGSHVDLAGRMAYWRDYTSAGSANPVDLDGHGTHVAGIATGTGAALGIGPGTLSYTDSGNLMGEPQGTIFANPVHLPAAPLTFQSVATWIGGSTDTLFLIGRPDGSSMLLLVDSASGSSPLTRTATFTPRAGDQFFSALPQTAPPIARYGIVNRVGNYAAVGDGFNVLRGVAPGCRWAGARVSSGGVAQGNDLSVALDDMVVQRVARNIKVANISLGLQMGQVDPLLRAKVNTMVQNGIFTTVAAGNSGPGGVITDPGRASLAMTVGASNDANELTSYTSVGFANPGADEDNKPDVLAPGGSAFRSMILAPDTNGSDAESATFADLAPNDYANRQGTSMAAPFVAGAGALVVEALERAGLTWTFGSGAHALLVKMLIGASATETNVDREAGTGNGPTLGRAAPPKDLVEGYGIVNPDAAVEAVTLALAPGSTTGTTTGTRADRRAWGRKIAANAGTTWTFNLVVPATGDYDLYLYAGAPDAKGNPVIVASSARPGLGVAESMTFTSTATTTVYLFVKRVSGSGAFSLGATNRPCGNNIVESGEQCDDGNLVDGDCCSSLCQLESNGSPCNDGNGCTLTDACQAGACIGSNPLTCTASDACHVAGVCNPSTGACSNPAAPDGTTCSDGNACTATDTCQSGACVGANPTTCIALDACHFAGTCHPVTGVCSNLLAPDGTVCNDGNACTGRDTCFLGTCVGANPTTCVALDACHVAGACDSATGLCSNPAAPDGTTCDDGNACTLTDACQAGMCAGSNPKSCPASDECHAAGVCIAPGGACPNVPLPDGTPCTGGTCGAGTCVPAPVDAGTDAQTSPDAGSVEDAPTNVDAPTVDVPTLDASPADAQVRDVPSVDAPTVDASPADAPFADVPASPDGSRADAADARTGDEPRPTADASTLPDAMSDTSPAPNGGDAAGSGADARAGDAPVSVDADVTPPVYITDSRGGCGCRIDGTGQGAHAVSAVLGIVAVAFLRRRRPST